jgi:hypothetical protein
MSRCGVCGVRASSFQLYRNKFIEAKKADLTNPEVVEAQKVFLYHVIPYNDIFFLTSTPVVLLLSQNVIAKHHI